MEPKTDVPHELHRSVLTVPTYTIKFLGIIRIDTWIKAAGTDALSSKVVWGFYLMLTLVRYSEQEI